jgi:leader peptidase (prepilin peptidase)/N-methyltransferase
MTARAVAIAVLGAATFALLGARDDADALALARLAICGAALGIAAAVDIRERRVPNNVVVPSAAACAALSVADGIDLGTLAAGLGVVTLLLVLSLARPMAMGMGDVKLAALIAFGLDAGALRAIALGVAFATLFGLLLLCLRGRRVWRQTLPLAPFLALGALAAGL